MDSQRKESGLPTVMMRGIVEASSKDKICELFREQFSSVFANERLSNEEISASIINVPSLSSIGAYPIINTNVVQKLKNS